MIPCNTIVLKPWILCVTLLADSLDAKMFSFAPGMSDPSSAFAK